MTTDTSSATAGPRSSSASRCNLDTMLKKSSVTAVPARPLAKLTNKGSVLPCTLAHMDCTCCSNCNAKTVRRKY